MNPNQPIGPRFYTPGSGAAYQAALSATKQQWIDPRHKEAFQLLNQKLRDEETGGARKNTSFFLITLLLFVGWMVWSSSDNGTVSVVRLATLVGTLLLHECGHFVAMKCFGYRDVSMFFIPFFGAAVKGRKKDVLPWQEVVMTLAGPLPGIFLGVPLLLLSTQEGHSWLNEIAFMLIVINAINLLPIKPLDGGRFFEIVLFCRWRWTSQVFAILSWIGFMIFLLKVVDISPIIVIGLVILQASVAWRQRKMRIKLREQGISKQLQPNGEADLEQAVSMFRIIDEVFGPSTVRPTHLAGIASQHLQPEQQQQPTGVAASIGLMVVYVGTVSLIVAAVTAYVVLRYH
ncbi:site-2 protease family protein [Prosthecobacter sp.]|uniref:site-2 protease family protein n=1 Tax=Prosthecobacter sp. TaxID=1965333 RepID=UPI00378427F2